MDKVIHFKRRVVSPGEPMEMFVFAVSIDKAIEAIQDENPLAFFTPEDWDMSFRKVFDGQTFIINAPK